MEPDIYLYFINTFVLLIILIDWLTDWLIDWLIKKTNISVASCC